MGGRLVYGNSLSLTLFSRWCFVEVSRSKDANLERDDSPVRRRGSVAQSLLSLLRRGTDSQSGTALEPYAEGLALATLASLARADALDCESTLEAVEHARKAAQQTGGP